MSEIAELNREAKQRAKIVDRELQAEVDNIAQRIVDMGNNGDAVDRRYIQAFADRLASQRGASGVGGSISANDFVGHINEAIGRLRTANQGMTITR